MMYILINKIRCFDYSFYNALSVYQLFVFC